MNLTTWEMFSRFGAALAIGILIGLERQYAHGEEAREFFGGVRTFALIALLGSGTAMLATAFTPWFFSIAFFGLVVLVATSYVVTSLRGDVGMTSEISALIVFVCGALSYLGQLGLAAAIAVVTAVLLSLKIELHRFAATISRQDVYASLKFAVITLIILPVLPNQTYGPLDVLNPYKIWLMVVFISGISFLGYVLIKVVGSERGIGLTGLLGGLVSSTAVTLSFSERSQKQPDLAKPFALAITVASTMMFVRILVEVAALNRTLLKLLWMPMALTAAAGLVACAYLFFSEHSSETGHVDLANPFELRPAVQFGLLFAVILFISKAAQIYLGSTGVYLSSAVAGLTDVDAITLSMADLAGGQVDYVTAARAVVLAAMSNTLVKGGIAFSTGSHSLRRLIVPAFVGMIVVGVVASFVLVG